MKSKRTKTAPTMWGCQLPKISQQIPLKVVLVQSAIDDTSYVRTLLDIGVIDPDKISDNAGTPRDILKQGLAAWFKERRKGLEYINFELGIVSPDTARDFVKNSDWGRESEPITRPCLAIRQYGQENCQSMRYAAEQLEKTVPGLFRIVLRLIEQSSYRTIFIRTPDELWHHYCYNWYGTDASETYTDDHLEAIREALTERLGDEDSIEEYMPEKKRKLFGVEHWGHTPGQPAQRNDMTVKELEVISQSPVSSLAQRVAAEAAVLQRLLDEANATDAKLPQLDNFGGSQCLYSGCCLQFADDPDVWQTLDDLGEMMMNAGDNCEYYGLEQLPETSEELAAFFKKLDIAFSLLRQMDKVIGLIADERDYEQGFPEEDDEDDPEGNETEPAVVITTPTENILETTN